MLVVVLVPGTLMVHYCSKLMMMVIRRSVV